MRQLGSLEADVARLEMTWKGYHHEMEKLTYRWEKREQRAASKEATQEEVIVDPTPKAEGPWDRYNRIRGIG